LWTEAKFIIEPGTIAIMQEAEKVGICNISLCGRKGAYGKYLAQLINWKV
jgi:hypothetical protein